MSEIAGGLHVSGLTKTYGDVTVVKDASFDLTPGTVTGFLGPNGAGKSTTLRMMLGLVRPDSGTASIEGQQYADLDHPTQTVGAVLESNDFHPGRSGRDHLRVLAAQASLSAAVVDEALEVVGLAKGSRKPIKNYSLGMRQRLGLAGAMLGEPTILILDEPANGLDPAGMNWLRNVLRGFADRGGTVLVSSHLLAEIAQTVDRVLILADGTLRADTDIASIQGNGNTLEQVYLDLTAEAVS